MADAAEPRCPFPHEGVAGDAGNDSAVEHWTDDARRLARERARQHAGFSHIDEDRAERMASRAVESRAEARKREQIDAVFVQRVALKLGYGHPLSERTGTLQFTWTPEAEARLQEVPEFCRELTRWRVEWTAHKQNLGTTITPDIMDVKYNMWGEVSHAIVQRHDGGMRWTDSARERLAGIPEFVRGQVMESVEGNARRLGRDAVDDDVIDSTIARWTETGDFHEGKFGFR